jgi:hypothetical protein
MNSFKNKCKRESTKNKIVSVSGSGHETHYSKKFIEQRKQSINTSCIYSLFKYCSNFVKMNLNISFNKNELRKKFNLLFSHK